MTDGEITREDIERAALRLSLRRKYDPALTNTAARDDLLTFTQSTFPDYNPAPHHKLIAEALQQVERGEVDRLIISMPPRHGKTELASVRFPPWYLGRHPDRRIIAASYSSSLAFRISRMARNVINGNGYPFDARLASDLSAVSQWDLQGQRGGYIAAGAGGGITGSGAHVLIIDDPIRNQEDADSLNYRDKIWEWYTSTAYTRLEHKGAVILIMTRWHADDLAGRLIAAQDSGGDKWEVLHLPALATEGDALGREPGEALWPEKYDERALDRIKQSVGSRVFAALYQGMPSNDDTSLLKREWWGTYGGYKEAGQRSWRPFPLAFDRMIQSWDMTFKGGQGSDYVVGQVWGQVGADLFLVDQVRGQWDFPRTLEEFRGLTGRYPAATVKLVEDTANGPAVIASLSNEIPGIIPVRPEGGKIARVNAIAGIVEAGNVYLPHKSLAPWIDDLIGEADAFPTGMHDDMVDALSQALVRLQQPSEIDPLMGFVAQGRARGRWTGAVA